MSELLIVDTFEEFLAYWEKVKEWPQQEQIEAWYNQYMVHWPELRQKQIDCYIEDGDDWQSIAHEFVFPYLTASMPSMREAHENLLAICKNIYDLFRQKLQIDFDLTCVIYVGIGCGAGWATTFENKPAVLFGLENIAQEKWQTKEKLSGLMAHELGHLAHFHWREQAGMANLSGPWWQLYTEGFAQYYEHLIQAYLSWHMQTSDHDSWLAWCNDHLGWLAGEFLERVDQGQDLRPFFGSWYNLQGYKQTGYFLGHELICRLREEYSLHEIALITEVEGILRSHLREIAQK